MGRELVVAITEGKVDLGPWEQIFYPEFDGKRRKRVLVKVIGEFALPWRQPPPLRREAGEADPA